jgi:Pollen protein Ole e 1 like
LLICFKFSRLLKDLRTYIFVANFSGAKVKLECKHFINGKIEHCIHNFTDSAGKYTITIANSHEDEICEVVLVDSSRPDCKEITPGRDRARAVLSCDTGISSNVRYPNALGFLKDKPLDVCGVVMKQYQLEDEY